MSDNAVMRARALIGVRFRLHGRNPGYGLDCVGLVAHVFGRDSIPTGYDLRGFREAELESALSDAGFSRLSGRAGKGDVLVMVPGPLQLHLGVWTGTGLVHADAGLRRVVETPGWPRWEVRSCWRPEQGES